MSLDWKAGGLFLGLLFFAAVLLVKPIGVSTQFVILDGIMGDVVNPALVTKAEDGWTSTNAYLAKSNGTLLHLPVGSSCSMAPGWLAAG